MHPHERAIESRKAGVRAKVEHAFLILKRDFEFTKTRDRDPAGEQHHRNVCGAALPRPRRPDPSRPDRLRQLGCNLL